MTSLALVSTRFSDPAPAADERFLRIILAALIAATIACGAVTMSLAVNAEPHAPEFAAPAQFLSPAKPS